MEILLTKSFLTFIFIIFQGHNRKMEILLTKSFLTFLFIIFQGHDRKMEILLTNSSLTFILHLFFFKLMGLSWVERVMCIERVFKAMSIEERGRSTYLRQRGVYRYSI